MLRSTSSRWLVPVTLITVLTCFVPPVSAASAPAASLSRAQAFEKRHQWIEACRSYDDLLHRDRNNLRAREGFQRCLRRFHLVRRHQDPIYRQALARLTPAQALNLYEEVLTTVSTSYVDRRRATLSLLFQQGIQELRFALEEQAFLRTHLPSVSPAALRDFQERLAAWPLARISTTAEAREQVRAVLFATRQAGISLSQALSTAFALEFSSGACNALDEYTLFLTPGHFSDVQATLRGKLVSIGADVGIVDHKLEIVRVYPHSPAQEAGLLRRDRIIRIDQQPVADLPAEAVAERLRGKAGEAVEVEVLSGGFPRTVKMIRRPVAIPSVDFHREYVTTMDPMNSSEMRTVTIGYLRVGLFQESTPQEVREALIGLQTGGIQGLILDLRNNPGGLFQSGVQVAELFLPEGAVIVQTQSPFRKYDRPYKVESKNPFEKPVVVLVDGDTASAAELVAGALENRRATLVIGQTTFGKTSIQGLFPLNQPPLEKTPGAIRITVARFAPPGQRSFTGHGITPKYAADPEGENGLIEARNQLITLINLGPMSPMMMR